MDDIWTALRTEVPVQVTAGAILALLAWAAISARRAIREAYGSWRKRRDQRRFLISRSDYTRLVDGIGESTLMHLNYYGAWDASGKLMTESEGPTVEIETPEGTEVWQVKLNHDVAAFDLALAARSHFGIKDQYYRLHHKPSHRDLEPKASVRTVVQEGDRLALVAHGSDAWGMEPKRNLPARIVRWWRRLRRSPAKPLPSVK